VISLLAIVANETIVPPTTRYSRTVFQQKIRRLGEWRPEVIEDFFAAGKDGRLWSAKTFSQDKGEMGRVIVDTYENGLMKYQIDAKKADWSDSGWTFVEGTVRQFHSDGVSIGEFSPFTERKFDFNEKPSDFALTEPEPEEMTYKQLKRHIRRLGSLGVSVRHLEVELMMKLAFPFACLVVTFLGVPLALKAHGSRAMGIAAAGVLTLAYMGFIQFGKALAQRHLAPWLGAWLGNVAFSLIGLYLWIRMKRTA
jgi:lipopolysaccharide export LptBFGC system permease protein LptF